jgi:DNA mismatch endonuclease, patch repair protein
VTAFPRSSRPGVPRASSPAALARMTATRRRDTAAELQLRAELRKLGLRYRLHRAIVPGVRRRPDVVFGPARVAVFVDGCFWHGCPEHGTMAKSNREFWQAKIDTNRNRDTDTDRRLAEAGWRVVRVWEHEDAVGAARRIAGLLRRVERTKQRRK